jgi:hypothetical protein
MLDLGKYRFVSFIYGPLGNTSKTKLTSVGVIKLYILVSHPTRGLIILRYETPTMPGYYPDKTQQDELHIGYGEVCFNLNEIMLNEKFPHQFNIK